MTALTTTNELHITEAQHAILQQSTPLEEIRFRPGRGGQQLAYTDVAFVIRTLNLAFGWDWDFEADHEEILYITTDEGGRPYEVRCRGKLTVRIGDRAISKTQFGSQPIEFLKNSTVPVSLGDAFKGAASDALKKCASLLGIALDLYDSDSDINSDTRKAQQAKQQAARNGGQAGPQQITPKVVTPAQQNGTAVSFDSPQAVIDAANAKLGQAYYKDPAHGFNALRKELGAKWTWPKPGDKEHWQEAYEFLVFHAENQKAAA